MALPEVCRSVLNKGFPSRPIPGPCHSRWPALFYSRPSFARKSRISFRVSLARVMSLWWLSM